MFRVYAFSETSNWSVDAASLKEARSAARAFERRGRKVRVYAQSQNEAGDTFETLVEDLDASL